MTTLRKIPQRGRTTFFVVLVDGREVGFLYREPNTRNYMHGWKAHRGIGATAVFLGTFFEKGKWDNLPDTDYSGKQGAIDAILRGL
jgi:hypothetical protein